MYNLQERGGMYSKISAIHLLAHKQQRDGDVPQTDYLGVYECDRSDLLLSVTRRCVLY